MCRVGGSGVQKFGVHRSLGRIYWILKYLKFISMWSLTLGNCERQREELQLKQKTYSLWGYLAVSFSTEDQFVNPLYDKENKELTNQILRPKIVPQNIKFWRELYCRFERGAHPREPLLDLLAITQNHTTSLEGKLSHASISLIKF